MEWMVPWTKLDHYQRAEVDAIEKSKRKIYWLTGFAGSGKTLVLIHAVRRFLESSDLNICYVTFTNALTEMAKTGLSNEERKRIKIETVYSFVNYDSDLYDVVIVDEIQDVTLEEFKKIEQRTNRKLIIAGDHNQQIYSNPKRISDEEIEYLCKENESLNHGHLRIVHRLTQNIKNIADKIFPDTDILTSESPMDISSLKRGSTIYLYQAHDEREEVNGIIQNLDRIKPKIGKPYGILFPNHNSIKKFCRYYCEIKGLNAQVMFDDSDMSHKEFYKKLNKFYSDCNINISYYGNGIGDIRDSDNHAQIYLLTYYSSKGLDFEKVFLPFLKPSCLDDAISSSGELIPNIDRRLLYVAVTRSRYDLVLSFSGPQPHEYIQNAVDSGLLSILPMPTQSIFDDDYDDDF